ncbi:hypothetical protein [Phocaeicola plebeius]|uniref:hypothetical protein n=1 Tax=Phocaeicola plebeius TaxID=310297 RepID=UPI0026EF195F|nr:hypothetical protein [Phocaeicola plebeius]
MQIKGMDGQSYSVTGQNQGNWNSAGGILGAASFFGINAGNILGRNGWGCNNDGYGCSDNTPVNRYELNLVTSLGAKDSEIALLKADKYTDQKIVEAVAYLQGEIGKVATKLENFNDAQNAVNLQQATYNATATANIGCIGQQVAQLQSMFNLVVPSNKVCDTCCNQ